MIKAPFPYAGGKSRVSEIIWKGFGALENYVEPFAGSLAVLLGNPSPAKIETVNDLDSHISNFWRAIANDPEQVAKFANYPVHETELHARHNYLINLDLKNKLENNVDYYDSKAAGYWIYGMSASIGNNWLQPKGLKAAPLLSSAGGGIQGLTKDPLIWFKEIQERIKRVRVCSGDWKRVITPSVTYNNVGISKLGVTGVFMDPPYSKSNREKVYTSDNNQIDIYSEVCEWAINNVKSNMRIIVCGYENDYKFPDDWQIYSWKGNGMGNLGNIQGKENLSRERIYFSPNCNKISD